MLKVSGIIKLTLRENLRGQILWTSALAGSTVLIMAAVLSGIALSHESRAIEVFSYFATDQLLQLIGIFSGAYICATDFSTRGLAELFIPAGVPRHQLYLARLLACSLVLLIVAAVLFSLKSLVLPWFADNPRAPDGRTETIMFLFAWLKGTAALSIAGFFGSLARPLYAILATLTLFAFGHISASFDSLLNSPLLNGRGNLSALNEFLYSAFKIWNPNLLVVGSVRGEWVTPDAGQILSSVSWGFGCLLVSCGFTLWRIQKIDLRP